MAAVIAFTPAEVDLNNVRAGDLNQISVTLTLDGAPYDLTDAVITSQARLTKADPVAIDAVITLVDATAGTFLLRWPGEEVRALLTTDTWRGVWDLQVLADGDPDPITFIAGKFTAELDVTRDAL